MAKNNKKKCFIDIESNQTKGLRSGNQILELSIISDDFEEEHICFNNSKINEKVKFLLSIQNESNNKYTNKKNLKEKCVYQKLFDISKKYDVYSYGDFDKKILKDVLKRYNLKKVKVIDYSVILKSKLKVKNKPSIRSLKFILDLKDLANKEHNSLYDAKLLYRIYKIIETSGKEILTCIRKKLNVEIYRPKLNILDVVNSKYVEDLIDDNYSIWLIESTITNKEEVKFYINKEIDEYVVTEPAKTIVNYSAKKYSNDGKFIIEKMKSYELNVKEGNKKEIDEKRYSYFQEFINDESIDFKNSVFICDKNRIDIFNSKKDKIFTVKNTISLSSFAKLKNDIKLFSRILKYFYNGNRFDEFITDQDYFEILSMMEIKNNN